jgi:hypothetical protein
MEKERPAKVSYNLQVSWEAWESSWEELTTQAKLGKKINELEEEIKELLWISENNNPIQNNIIKALEVEWAQYDALPKNISHIDGKFISKKLPHGLQYKQAKMHAFLKEYGTWGINTVFPIIDQIIENRIRIHTLKHHESIGITSRQLSQYNNTFIEDQSKNIWQKVEQTTDKQLQTLRTNNAYIQQYNIFDKFIEIRTNEIILPMIKKMVWKNNYNKIIEKVQRTWYNAIYHYISIFLDMSARKVHHETLKDIYERLQPLLQGQNSTDAEKWVQHLQHVFQSEIKKIEHMQWEIDKKCEHIMAMIDAIDQTRNEEEKEKMIWVSGLNIIKASINFNTQEFVDYVNELYFEMLSKTIQICNQSKQQLIQNYQDGLQQFKQQIQQSSIKWNDTEQQWTIEQKQEAHHNEKREGRLQRKINQFSISESQKGYIKKIVSFLTDNNISIWKSLSILNLITITFRDESNALEEIEKAYGISKLWKNDAQKKRKEIRQEWIEAECIKIKTFEEENKEEQEQEQEQSEQNIQQLEISKQQYEERTMPDDSVLKERNGQNLIDQLVQRWFTISQDVKNQISDQMNKVNLTLTDKKKILQAFITGNPGVGKRKQSVYKIGKRQGIVRRIRIRDSKVISSKFGEQHVIWDIEKLYTNHKEYEKDHVDIYK